MTILEQIISYICPHECLGCGAEGQLLCSGCISLLPPLAPRCYRCHSASDGFLTCRSCRHSTPLKEVIVATEYDTEQVKQLVHGLKFGRQAAGAEIMAQAIAEMLPADLEDVILVHVPTANQRVRLRGYDQSRLIVRHLSRMTGLTYSPLLARVGTQRQTGRTRAERLRQMEGAFRPIRLKTIANSHVVLVDDIITTGATLESAARVLRAAGAKTVTALAFATA